MQLRCEKTIWTVVGAVAFVLAMGVLFLFDPAHGGFYPICWFHRLTGLNCPGCGSLRAVHHLLHGQLTAAFRCNPLLVISVPLIAGFLLTKLFNMATGKKASAPKRNHIYFFWLIILVLVLFGVVRNLPYPAFAWMSP